MKTVLKHCSQVHKYPFQLLKFSTHAPPTAQSQQTVAVVKLEDSSREKREGGK